MERKAYCVDMKDALIKYANRHQIDSEQFKMIVLELAQKMDQIDKVYETTIRHIETISLTSLSVLPKKFDDYKKALKTADQKPSELQKIKDFEYDRIEFTKMSVLHFINAQMYLHAKVLEIYSGVYNQLNLINYATEFKDFDRQMLKGVFVDLGLVVAGSSGGASSRLSIQKNSQNVNKPNSARRHA